MEKEEGRGDEEKEERRGGGEEHCWEGAGVDRMTPAMLLEY